MNYKILAVSGALTVGLIAFGLIEATTPTSENRTVEHVMSVDVPSYDVAEPAAPQNEFGFMEAQESSVFAPSPPAAMAPPAPDALENSEVPPLDVAGSPKIAYRYGFSFRLPVANLKPLQERHADMCEQMGATQCRILSMEQSDADERIASGTLHLAVASSRARAFGKQLATTAQGAEGELTGSSIEGEDLSKDIVDTEARLRARTVLRDRLLEVLRTRRGTVKELVEAERGVAQVNEEIDQATSWLAEMRSRIEFSRVSIGYDTMGANRSGFADPIVGAWSAAGPTFGAIIALVMRMLTVFVPLGLLGWLIFRLWKLAGRPGRGMFERDDEMDAAAA